VSALPLANLFIAPYSDIIIKSQQCYDLAVTVQ